MTPTRDRCVDLVRALSLLVVVLGHWLITVVERRADGSTAVTNLLGMLPAARPATWLLQVMPLFFLVGGFAHARAWASVRRRGGGYAAFVRARTGRLLRPAAVFVATWLAGSLLLEVAGADGPLVRTAARTVAQPLWFLGVYLALVLLAPALWRLHERAGPAVPVLAAGAVAAVDALRFNGLPQYGWLNLLLVWGALHQLGYGWADGTLLRGGRRLAAGLAAGGLTAVVLLTVAGPYPVSMVGVPGEPVSNMSPPTLALYAHGIWLTGLVLLLRPALGRVLDRPAVWAVVVAASRVAMTVFLWHLTAMVLVVAAVAAAGVRLPAANTLGWWATRPLWLAALALTTALLVLPLRRAERPPARFLPWGGRRAAGWRVGAGGTLCTLAVFAFSTVGFGGILAGRTATMIAVPVTAVAAAALWVAGAALLATVDPAPHLR